MNDISNLLKYNSGWAASQERQYPGLLAKLSAGQSPDFLWIGCCDSRIPAETLTGVQPGQMLVHRNIANLVSPDDPCCLSVIEFAVDMLQVGCIMVVGHSDCGGIKLACQEQEQGAVGQWLRPVCALRNHHRAELAECDSPQQRIDRLVVLNVEQQVRNTAELEVVQSAWQKGRPLVVYGCVYDVATGILRSPCITVSGASSINTV